VAQSEYTASDRREAVHGHWRDRKAPVGTVVSGQADPSTGGALRDPD